MEELAKLIVNYGLGIVLSCAILGMATYLLRKTFQQHENERGLWHEIAEKHFDGQQKAADYQRIEHQKIQDGLDKTREGLTEAVIILKSINGKK